MMEHPLIERVRRDWPLETWKRHRTLVAVSGGADSVALLRALVEIGGTATQLHVAHFDHRIRGEQSAGDAVFVAELSAQLGIPCDAERASSPAGSEAEARSQRYDFLIHSAYRNGCGYVATAHHRDDRVETTLHNIFRGSGLAGAATPRRFRPLDADLVLVRPLLSSTRADITGYLQQLGQPHRTDATNQDTKFRRNFLRRQVLPELRNVYPNVDDSIHRFSEVAEEAVELLHELAAEYLCRVDASSGRPNVDQDCLVFPTLSRLAERWPIVQAAIASRWEANKWPLQSMTRKHWSRLRTLLDSPNSANQECIVVLPGEVRAELIKDWLVLTRESDK